MPNTVNKTTGVAGITFKTPEDMFRVRVFVRGMKIHIGTYKTLEEAKIAKELADIQYLVNSPLF